MNQVICRDCKHPFDADRVTRRGRFPSRCEACRLKRNRRRYAIEAGATEKHYCGNGRDKAAAVCPVCGEPRRVETLCKCEIQLSPALLEADYLERWAA